MGDIAAGSRAPTRVCREELDLAADHERIGSALSLTGWGPEAGEEG